MTRSRASRRILVVTTLMALAAAGCGSGGTAGKSAAPQQKTESAARVTWQRVQPTLRPSPITYSVGRVADKHELYYSNGSVMLSERPVSFRLGYRVQQNARDDSELLAANMRSWRLNGVRPTPFQAGGGTGYWGEENVSRSEEPGAPGTYRTYVLARGAVTATLSVFAPEGVELTDPARSTADRIIRSVRFDESGLTARSSGRQVEPVVPFTFERPSSMPGPNNAEFGQVYWSKYTFDGVPVEVSLQRREYAKGDYRDKVAALGRTEAEAHDVKTTAPTAETVGRQVDEGVGSVPRTADGVALEYFVLRKGDLLLEIRSTGTGGQTLSQRVQQAVASILTSMKFT